MNAARVWGLKVALVACGATFGAGCPQFDPADAFLCDAKTACPDGRRCDLANGRCESVEVGVADGGHDGGAVTDEDAGSPDAGEVQSSPCDDVPHDEALAAGPQLSVLFVVDDSAGMESAQNVVVGMAGQLKQAFDEASLNWRAAFTTTDTLAQVAGSLADLGDGVLVVRDPDSNAVDLLMAGLLRGSGGSSDERGLDAVLGAMVGSRAPQVHGQLGGPNRSLLVVLLSNEDDHSVVTPASLAEQLRNDPRMVDFDSVSAWAIVGPTGGCSGGSGVVEAGTRYLEFVTAIGGASSSLCAPAQFTVGLQAALQDAERAGYHLDVGHPGSPASVHVWSSGTGSTPDSTWSYVAADHALRLPGRDVGEFLCVKYPD